MCKPADTPSSHGNFDRIVEPFNLDSASIQVTKWKSRETGLTIVWADVEGTLIKGVFAVADEIHSNSAASHVLKHLIFLGSKKYPFKGLLNDLTKRAFAIGSGAWTDPIRTAFTITTVGSDGFLKLLPIYLDHILYPTLTSECFTTEVHHINGKGEEAGVVYSEFQERQKSSGYLMDLRNQQLLYSSTKDYRSETGDIMEALRVLTIEQIRQYHHLYYCPKNLQLIVIGKINPTELLSVLSAQVEPSLIQHGQNQIPAGWRRPFLETPRKECAKLEKSQTVEVQFPANNESWGEVQISWVGPDANDFLLQTALEVLGTYLTDSAVSSSAKKLIEIYPFIEITFRSADAEKTIITAYLSSIPSEHLDSIGDLFRKALAQEAPVIDIGRLKMVIEQVVLMTCSQMEEHVHHRLRLMLISNFLYGDDPGLIVGLSSELQRYKTLASWSADEWSAVFKKWLVDRPSICIIGKPSVQLSNKLKAHTKQRVEETRKKYGAEGLKKLEEELTHAQEVNDRPYPDKFLLDFPVPDLRSIPWIDVQIAHGSDRYDSDLQSLIDSKDSSKLPFFVQFNHIKSNFLTIHVNLSPPDLPAELFPFLPAYLYSFFSLPINRSDGTRLSCDEVVRQLDAQTVGYGINLGVSLRETLEICIKVEKSKYATAISWLRDLLWGSVFDVDRLQIGTTPISQGIPSRIGNGIEVSTALYDQMIFSPDLSPATSINLFQLESSLPKILEQLNLHPEDFVRQMERLRSHLLQTSSLRISVSGDILSLEEPKSTWMKNFQSLESATMQEPLLGNAVLTPDGSQPSGKVLVMTMSSIESSYAYHVARGPEGFDHPDIAALTIAINVLKLMESHEWKAICGIGVAQGASIGSDYETGHVFLNIYGYPDSSEVFLEAGRVLRDLIDRKLNLNETILQSAKGDLVYKITAISATGPSAAHRAFADVALKNISKGSLKHLLEKSREVTMEEVVDIIKKYFLPIFDSKSSIAAIASSANKASQISDCLKSVGYSVEFIEKN